MSGVGTWSLRTRLVLVSLFVLLLFVGLTGVAIDRAFRESADTAQQARLEALLYLLMGRLEVSDEGALQLPAPLPDARLELPGSGLYAIIHRRDPVSPGTVADRVSRPATEWRSPSTAGVDVPQGVFLSPGQRRVFDNTADDGSVLRIMVQGVRWSIGPEASEISFSIAAPLSSTGSEVAAYRRSLWSALTLTSLALVLALLLVQHWGLRPLHTLARRLAAMERGEADALAGTYPAELAPLVDNLARLLASQQTMLARHRNALGDLAHSLKTPLAVLSGTPSDASLAEVVQTQTRRMDEIIRYQLQRASTAGASQIAPARLLLPLVERLQASLGKVYQGRSIQFQFDIEPDLRVRMDEGDALELLGNLLDNACKWGHTKVWVSASRGAQGLVLTVEDDGPGMNGSAWSVQRGLRGDEHTPGHGIGLAMVQDIALAYQGKLDMGRSRHGGACMRVTLTAC